MIKLEDKTMKKQYFIPQVETMPLFNMNALCASGDSISFGNEGIPPEDAL